MKEESKNRFLLYTAIYLAWLCLLFVLTGGIRDVHAWMHSWIQWDAYLYEELWEVGYAKSDPKVFAFPPGYPLLIGGISRLLPLGFHGVAMAVNIGAYGLACVVMAELLGELMEVPPVALFCLALTSPAAYCIFSVYSDALFMLMLWMALYLALLQPFGWKARIAEFLLLLAVPWVRLNGFALAIWALLRRWSAAGVLLSLGGWLALNGVMTGDIWHFIAVQRLFNLPPGTFIDGLADTASGFWHMSISGLYGYPINGINFLQMQFLPLLYLALLMATAAWFCLRGQWLIGLTLPALILMSHNMIYWRSVVRYDLPVMPCMFVPLLCWAKKRNSWQAGLLSGVLLGAAGLAQLLLLICFAIRFKAGMWVF